jgi:Fe-S cluster assembly protein SufD
MTTVADRTTPDTLVAAFDRLERERANAGPAWLRADRRKAIARVAERGLPTTRDEDWKYTSIAPIEETSFDLAAEGPGERLAPAALEPFLAGRADWHRLVFVQGRYSARLSAANGRGDGVRLASLADALTGDGERLGPELVNGDAQAADAWTALNLAFWRDGALVEVPAGVMVERPIHLLFLTAGRDPGPMTHPRSVVILGRGSRATVIETYATVSGGTYLTNPVTRLVVGEGAALFHLRIEQESRQAFHVGRTEVRQERDSRLSSTAVFFGGRIARQDVRVRLEAEGADCALHGLYVIGGRQHVDINTVVDHAKPRGTSRQLYKGVLDGRARGVFSGRVIVRPGAQKTDAYQSNKNLLLSDGVEVDSKPQLEIFADDVKCSHGAADGQLAADALFYLRSRGLGEAEARALLTYGFASEVLGRIPLEPVRTRLETLLRARLEGGRVNEEVA